MKNLWNWLVRKYFIVIFLWNRKKLEKELDNELDRRKYQSDYGIHMNDTERKYAEGMSVLKGKLRDITNSFDTEGYDQALKAFDDLVGLAIDETDDEAKLRKIFTRLSNLPEKSKTSMVEERIQHYGELKTYNESKNLSRRIKKAERSGDRELADQLLEEWKEKYGKIRNIRRR